MKKIPYKNIVRIFENSSVKKKFVILVFFSILISIIESVGVSAIMPLVDISTNLSVIHENHYYQKVFDFTGLEKEVDFAIILGFILFVFYLLRGVMNYVYNHKMSVFSQNIYSMIAQELYKVYMEMPYKEFVNKNSSYLSKVIVTEASLFSASVSSFLLMISEIFVVIFLYVLILLTSWEVTLVFTFFILLKSILLVKTVSKKIKKSGRDRSFHHANIYEALNRTFGNFKHIKLQNKDVTNGMKSDFNMAVERYTYANIINGKLSVLPRLALETTGFSLIVLTLVYILYKEQTNITHILPIVALFVLVLYRLLPSINRIFNAFNTIMYNYKSIEIINQELETNKDVIDDNLVSFNKKIELKDVGFRFGDFNVINQANMIINKYEKVAIIGASGSGKSTLVDIIIGLYKPVDGLVKIDDTILDDKNMQYWRSKVGYINQQVYLFDGTVSDNVVFGRKFDHNLLTDVLKKSNIYDFLMTKDGFDTMVGENGCQLSGGQKQRMVIARALYGDPEILILDEATSALDEKTEEKIMDEIYQIAKYKTMIIITHRLKAVKNCDSVYRIEKGRVYAT